MKSMLMSAEMVRAILDGRKTQTRRPVKPQPPADTGGLALCDDGRTWMDYPVGVIGPTAYDLRSEYRPRYLPGDVVYVKETWAVMLSPPIDEWPVDKRRECTIYGATHMDARGVEWRWAGRMPEWAARLFIRIDAVDAEYSGGKRWWVYTFSRVERPEVK